MRYSTLFTKQKMMRTVLIALIPVTLVSIYFFGWRHLVMGLLVALAGAVSEYLVMRSINREKAKISEAVFVTAALFTLSLPPLTPMWIAVVGMIFAIVFGKAAFGGFGRNIFNPALVGRCFVYIAFPTQLTMQWPLPFATLPGGFAAWSAARGADVIASATPNIVLNATGEATPLLNLFLGNIPGSLGETSAVMILLGAAYLLYKKVASWQLMVSTLAGAGLLATVLYYTGISSAAPLFVLLSAGLMFGAVFMVTDPISAPKIKAVQWLAGGLVGIITVIIRSFGLFTEGVMFAILIVNALTPLFELKYSQYKDKKKLKAKEAIA
ncbi:MAG: RnfABCDGE type electron transport complex subunit D [Clostridiales bacterium]|nr:RnfABCDGE type electron transport complex subunit D [Clostridiales bacterium]